MMRSGKEKNLSMIPMVHGRIVIAYSGPSFSIVSLVSSRLLVSLILNFGYKL